MILLPFDHLFLKPMPYMNLATKAVMLASIKKRGIMEPVKVRRSTMEVIDGTRRCHLAMEAGLTEVPCELIDFTDEELTEYLSLRSPDIITRKE